MSDRIAAIDIGTNTVLMRIAARADDGTITTLAERATITRLGRGVDATGTLSENGIRATLVALESYANDARTHSARVLVVGTSALRDATNAASFTVKAERILGVPIEIIAGMREAELTCRGAFFDLTIAGPACVVDIGGGSTEVVRVNDGAILDAQSIDIGSVRLFERFLHSDPPSDEELRAMHECIETQLRTLPREPQSVLVAVAGTATTVATIIRGVDADDIARVHNRSLSIADVAACAEKLARMPRAERLSLRGLSPERADVVIAGSAILAAVATRGDNHIVVSDAGVRVGLIAEAWSTTHPAR